MWSDLGQGTRSVVNSLHTILNSFDTEILFRERTGKVPRKIQGVVGITTVSVTQNPYLEDIKKVPRTV